MGDTMLHGVLRMPPELWTNTPIDIQQRHSRYLEASDELARLRAENEAMREALCKVKSGPYTRDAMIYIASRALSKQSKEVGDHPDYEPPKGD